MFNTIKTEVLVVGAGPIGMLSALILKRKGINATIIDAADGTTTRSNSTLLTPTTLSIFQRWGLLDDVMEIARPISSIELYDQTTKQATLDYSKLDTKFPFLVSISQAALELVLEKHLNENGVAILWNHKATDLSEFSHETEIEVQRLTEQSHGYAISHMERMIDKTKTVRSKFVLACDGFNSIMRKRVRASRTCKRAAEHYIYFDCKTTEEPNPNIRISFSGNLKSVQIPLPHGFTRLMFQFDGLRLPEENRHKSRNPIQLPDNSSRSLKESYMNELITQRFPWETEAIERITWRKAVTFESFLTDQCASKRLILQGDAARTFSPISSNSINLGMLEVEEISSILAGTLYNPRLPDSIRNVITKQSSNWLRLYDLYSRPNIHAHHHNWAALNSQEILPCLPAIDEEFTQLTTQLKIDSVTPVTLAPHPLNSIH